MSSSPVTAAQVTRAGEYIIFIVAGLVVQTLFFGLYTVLILFSTRMLLNRGLKAQTNKIIFTTTVFMYILSTAYWAYSVADVVDRMRIYVFTPRSPLAIQFTFLHDGITKWSPLFNAIVLINYVLSDGVVVWRAWIICPRHRAYLWITIGFLILTTASVASTIVFRIVAFIQSPIDDLSPDSVLNKGINILQISNVVMSLLSNLSATAVVGVTAWKNRRNIRAAFTDGKKGTKADQILGLIVESGVLYCVASLITITTELIRTPEGTLGDLWSPVSIQIAGAYPAVVLLGVAMQKTQGETTVYDSDGT
ncbi:hypothetical protein C8R44DRAFT_763436 [Mycena epipterygia]|nr:hypothetical protein C8R44DRAFT_763436 [Mycena epipterygia]